MRLEIPRPSEKQEKFLTDKHRHVGYGGARGGGKSWAIRVKAILLCAEFAGIKVMIVRRTYPELTENHIEPLKDMLHVGQKGAPARYNDSKKTMRFANGSRIIFKYCDSEKDTRGFQGLEADVLFIDEATQLSEIWIKKITACVRGANNFPKRTYYTCNPGGESHAYIKRLFIDRKYESGEYPEEYSFTQALLTDNKALMESDPEYIRQLESLPHKLREAWLNGRWDVFEGAYFEEFRETPDPQKCHDYGISVEDALAERRFTHVIEPFEVPEDWKIYRSYDWGYGKPFSCAWWAVDYEGVAYRIIELYGCTKTPNEGLKWSNKEQFDKIAEIEREHRWLKGKRIQGVADPSIWDGSHGISAAEEAEKHQLWFEPGINDRIPGWMQVRERMKFDENGRAMMYFFNTCKAIIRCMPLMMFDEHKVEDLDTSLEDHCLDECRYFCMMRPIAPRQTVSRLTPMCDPLNQYTEKYSRYNDARVRIGG
ncbi:MAG: phage terminase large subunit [Lachnospiraceae bacterium]|nr:phage terminase large subunit [Lachnospiraceae bacterium]